MFSRMGIGRHTSGQLPLPGFEQADRLFFALFPEAASARCTTKIARGLCTEIGLRAQPFAQHRFHVSLHFLGNYDGAPNEIVAKARDAASMVAAAPFGVTFDLAETLRGRPGNLPLVLRSSDPSKALFALHHALGEAMARTGLGRWASPQYYLPHMTLLYDARDVEPRAVEPVEWTVREFVLVHSLRGQRRYVALARWPLSGLVSEIPQ